MSPKSKVRLAGLFLILLFIPSWAWVSFQVFQDYLALLNQEPIVRVSVITLWLPIGFLGVVLCLLVISPKSLFYGRKVNEIYSSKTMRLVKKISIYFALAGVAFAAGWTYHSIDLLERYGYVYSQNLTKITPTGIHLVYVRAN
ncbi:TPA: hypothetical protein I7704_09025 [Vibrio vulnificus]|uniref:hypothetical protein n=1 Tax=Vibrio navarrensis TaxID=29495 RepID=UPI001869DCBD|nr:hypothetical protein [Vibrio navarrensis]MBE4621028.1 hypothetical protein [Vibrio navarrensis]HAS8196475.1 hypothetical protein [Vibrio vulnificus]HAS8364578.1 hypothetical protein [Vibrio vulnificus]